MLHNAICVQLVLLQFLEIISECITRVHEIYQQCALNGKTVPRQDVATVAETMFLVTKRVPLVNVFFFTKTDEKIERLTCATRGTRDSNCEG